MRSLAISLFILWSALGWAKNQFIYIRYNPMNANPSAIVSEVEELISKGDTFVVFLSNSSMPMVGRTFGEWREIRTTILTMQVAPDFYGKIEMDELNLLFTQIFKEKVSPNLIIMGDNDSNWSCTFILPEKMYDSPLELDLIPIELVQINDLEARIPVNYLIFNDESKLRKINTVKK